MQPVRSRDALSRRKLGPESFASIDVLVRSGNRFRRNGSGPLLLSLLHPQFQMGPAHPRQHSGRRDLRRWSRDACALRGPVPRVATPVARRDRRAGDAPDRRRRRTATQFRDGGDSLVGWRTADVCRVLRGFAGPGQKTPAHPARPVGPYAGWRFEQAPAKPGRWRCARCCAQAWRAAKSGRRKTNGRLSAAVVCGFSFRLSTKYPLQVGPDRSGGAMFRTRFHIVLR